MYRRLRFDVSPLELVPAKVALLEDDGKPHAVSVASRRPAGRSKGRLALARPTAHAPPAPQETATRRPAA
eukprot:1268763-Pyramimonas_sp.AAC.1